MQHSRHCTTNCRQRRSDRRLFHWDRGKRISCWERKRDTPVMNVTNGKWSVGISSDWPDDESHARARILNASHSETRNSRKEQLWDFETFTLRQSIIRNGTIFLSSSSYNINGTPLRLLWYLQRVATAAANLPVAHDGRNRTADACALRPSIIALLFSDGNKCFNWKRMGAFDSIHQRSSRRPILPDSLNRHRRSNRLLVFRCS